MSDKCEAVQHSDMMVCEKCGLKWDTNDAYPPKCWRVVQMSKGGHKDDHGKIRMELIPPEFLEAVGDILTSGAEKYADRNWEHGMKWSRPFGAMMRHMWAWWRGEDKDPETGRSHLWHASCCVAFLVAYEARGDGTDDRWKGPKNGQG